MALKRVAVGFKRDTPPKKGPLVKKYGNRNVSKMLRQINALRAAIRAEGTPAIQSAWDAVEEHIDYAYRADAPVELSRKA